ncbi:MAG: hypothetical protein QXL89_09525, partial [Nitrososphaeria archaeon]
KRYYSYSIKFFRLKYAGKRRLGLFKFFGSYRIFDLPYWATLWVEHQIVEYKIMLKYFKYLLAPPMASRFRAPEIIIW